MWPWDHAAVAYLLLSAYSRSAWGRPPTRGLAAVGVFAALLPDLIDKPLSWWLAVLPSGRSLGHSVLVAVPLAMVVLALGATAGRRHVAAAFVLGHLSHLAGDVAYPLFVDGELRLGFLFWPVVTADSEGAGGGLPYLGELIGEFLAVLATPGGVLYLVVDAVLLGGAVAVWLFDRRALRELEPDTSAAGPD
ncbi:MAG: metal-dependent hydrolase [Halolamina sp.]